MKTFYCLFVTCFFNTVVFAQNWQMFPLDSMRVFINPIQQGSSLPYLDDNRITGIDFRDHSSNGDTVFINLAEFTRLTPMPHYPHRIGGADAFFLSGNSNFGHTIFYTPNSTNLVFKNTNPNPGYNDTLVFLNKFQQGKEWKVFDNQFISLDAKFTELHRLPDGDSTYNIELNYRNKGIADSAQFSMVVSKNFGLKSTIVFYDLIHWSEPKSLLPTVELQSYQEMTERDFLKPRSKMVKHWSSAYYDGTPPPESEYGSEEFVSSHQNKLTYRITTVSTEWEFNSNSNQYEKVVTEYSDSLDVREVDTLNVYNPIPGKRSHGHGIQTPHHELGGYLLCNQQVLIFGHNDSYREELIDDTLFRYGQVTDRDYQHEEIMRGTGRINFMRIYLSSDWHWDFKYLELNNHCILGEKLWRLTSIPTLEGEPQIVVYPNPAQQTVHIGSKKKIKTVTLVNLNGQTLLEESSLLSNKLKLPDLAPGLYLLQINTESGSSVHRLSITP